MSLSGIYNKIAGHYNIADKFGSIIESHQCAITQIEQAELGLKPPFKVLDLGVGDGSFLQKLASLMPEADFTGIDVSAKMLELAKSAVALKTIETSAAEATQYLPHHSQDLVLAHFVNAYIPIHTLFSQAKLLTRANGYFSLITTTYDSFPAAQQQLAEFISKGNLLSKIVGHYYKAVVKNTTVAGGLDELLANFAEHQFRVIAHQRIYLPIKFEDLHELILFGVEGTWFLNSLAVRVLPRNFLFPRLNRLFKEIFSFPFKDTHIIDIILAQK